MSLIVYRNRKPGPHWESCRLSETRAAAVLLYYYYTVTPPKLTPITKKCTIFSVVR